MNRRFVNKKREKNGWGTLQEWTTKISRWKTWKKVALCGLGIFVIFVVSVMFTTPMKRV